MINKNHISFSVNVSTLILLIFSTVLSFACIAYYFFYKLDEKCNMAIKQAEMSSQQCYLLIQDNAGLRAEILSLKSAQADIKLPTVDSLSGGSGMSDTLILYLTNLSCILAGLLALGLISYFSYSILMKYLIAFSKTFVFKGAFGMLSFSELFKPFIDSSITLPSEFSYLDQFDNTVKVLLSQDQKTTEVFIKLYDSNVFVPLADVLCKYQTLLNSSNSTDFEMAIVDLASSASSASGGALSALNSLN